MKKRTVIIMVCIIIMISIIICVAILLSLKRPHKNSKFESFVNDNNYILQLPDFEKASDLPLVEIAKLAAYSQVDKSYSLSEEEKIKYNLPIGIDGYKIFIKDLRNYTIKVLGISYDEYDKMPMYIYDNNYVIYHDGTILFSPHKTQNSYILSKEEQSGEYKTFTIYEYENVNYDEALRRYQHNEKPISKIFITIQELEDGFKLVSKKTEK